MSLHKTNPMYDERFREPTIAETLLEVLNGKHAQFTFDRQREILTALANRIKQMENTYEHQF